METTAYSLTMWHLDCSAEHHHSKGSKGNESEYHGYYFLKKLIFEVFEKANGKIDK